MDVTDTVLAAVTAVVALMCCAGTLLGSVCCVRKYVILRQNYRQRLSTEEEFVI